jgi:ABC-type glutathione transport system ATPase component
MEGSPRNALEVHGLTIEYGELPALKSVDLSVGHGRIVGIVGESGSGKSTLASALIWIAAKFSKNYQRKYFI